MKSIISEKNRIKSTELSKFIDKEIIIDSYIHEKHYIISGKLKSVDQDKREIEIIKNNKSKVILFNNIDSIYKGNL